MKNSVETVDYLEKKNRIIGAIFADLHTLGLLTDKNRPFPDLAGPFFTKVNGNICSIEKFFYQGEIPVDLLSLVIAHAIRKVWNQSNIYKKYCEANSSEAGQCAEKSRTLQEMEYRLSLIFTQCARLRGRREERSHLNLHASTLEFNSKFHGEFAYALLHMLNQHRLTVSSSHHDLFANIARTTNLWNFIIDKSNGSSLGWRNASKYAVDTLLSQRKKKFCTAIDDAQAREYIVGLAEELNKPVTLVLWNRKTDRDANRRLGLNIVNTIVEYVEKEKVGRTLRLVVLGDLGGLEDIEHWARMKGIIYRDYRNEHMRPAALSPPTEPVGGDNAKDEQLYRIRGIMKAFNPDLIFGVRSGLVALCALVGCPGLQIDMADASSTHAVPRVEQKHSSQADRDTKANDPIDVDTRLLDVFARCPVDGMGSHLILAGTSPNPDKAMIYTSNEERLQLTISAMMAAHDDFQPLMLETLASYLSGGTNALPNLRALLNAYLQSQVSSIRRAESAHGSSDGSGDSDHSDDYESQDKDSNGGGKSGGSSFSANQRQTFPGGGCSGPNNNTMHHTRSLSCGGIVMDLKTFLSTYSTLTEQKNYFSASLMAEQIKIVTDAIHELTSDQFISFCSDIIEEGALNSLLQYDDFILVEHALHTDKLAFILRKLGNTISELVKTSYILRCALQLKPSDDAKSAFDEFKPYTDLSVFMDDDCLLIRSMTDNIGAEYAWSQLKQLTDVTDENKKQAIIADNYMLFRRASLSGNREQLLSEMSCFLTANELYLGVNAYDGDVVYQAISGADKVLFDRYFPMLNEEASLDLEYRISTDTPDLLGRFYEWRTALPRTAVVDSSMKMTTLQRSSFFSTPTPKNTPTRIVDLGSPNENGNTDLKVSGEKETGARLLPSDTDDDDWSKTPSSSVFGQYN